MMKQSLLALGILSSTISFGQSHGGSGGFIPPYVFEAIEEAKANAISCSDEDYLFDSYESTLTIGDRVYDLVCEKVVQGEVHPDQPLNLLNCVEDRAGDGRISVEVNTFGFIPGKLATVKIGQMFPLKPMKLADLGCQN
ncbi:MAG: hypothetical protein EOP07_02910 [Proteobacteria bacterium]|nr:MAG: hypothetical protein EOP07_02910 [Pseudomonadota bacterium]